VTAIWTGGKRHCFYLSRHRRVRVSGDRLEM
jgi:hypothetical protein